MECLLSRDNYFATVPSSYDRESHGRRRITTNICDSFYRLQLPPGHHARLRSSRSACSRYRSRCTNANLHRLPVHRNVRRPKWCTQRLRPRLSNIDDYVGLMLVRPYSTIHGVETSTLFVRRYSFQLPSGGTSVSCHYNVGVCDFLTCIC